MFLRGSAALQAEIILLDESNLTCFSHRLCKRWKCNKLAIFCNDQQGAIPLVAKKTSGCSGVDGKNGPRCVCDEFMGSEAHLSFI